MPFVDKTPRDRAADDGGGERLRYAQVMPLLTALQGLAKDGPTPECRAQALALTACRVLLPPPHAPNDEAHAAYVNVLRAMLDVPWENWPAEARVIRAAAQNLLHDAA